MPLGPGSRLDAYEVVRPLGAGGMGEVWLATELRLGRKVALKLLPADLTRDPSRVQRFEQEARAASALSHPNVCHIYALGQTEEGQHYIAMEYVEGETLRRRLSSTRLSIREAVDIAIQVAAALSAAHALGIVHRDIKPENVMLRPDGFVKVLDFGLAKLAPTSPDIAGSGSTRTALKTDVGTVVGTAAYMSPEQARGQEVDARTDIWSLGVMLYEVIAGRSPFAGPSGTDVLAAILDREPAPLARFEPESPAELQRILTKTLRKDRAQRYQTVQDLLLDLRALRDEAQARSASAPVTELPDRVRSGSGPTSVSAPLRRRFVVIAAAATMVVVGAGALLWRLPPSFHRTPDPTKPPPTLLRITAQPVEDPVLTASVSPDGKYVAYSDRVGIHIKAVASGETHLVPDTRGMEVFAWSADGTKVRAARSDGRTYTGWDVAFLPGVARRSGRQWSAADVVVFAPGDAGLARLTDGGDLWVYPTDGSPQRRLIQADKKQPTSRISAVAWSKDGQRLIFAEGADVYTAGVNGTPRTFMTKIPADVIIMALVQLPSGRVIASTWARSESGLWEIAIAGTATTPASPPRLLTSLSEGLPVQLSASDDGKYLTFQKEYQQGDVYIADLDTARPRLGTPRRLTMDERDDMPTAWMPDGSAVLFFSSRNGSMDIFKQRLDSDGAEPLVTGPAIQDDPRVSSDGKWILFRETDSRRAGQFRIMRLPVDGGTPEQVITRSGFTFHRCPRHGPCVLIEFHANRGSAQAVSVAVLDPTGGRGKELLRAPLGEFGMDVSPTADRFAYIVPESAPRNRIRIVPFNGDRATEIVTARASALVGLDWISDGSGFLTANTTVKRTDLLLVRPTGHSDVLWSGDRRAGIWAVPSPDTKRVALYTVTRQSDVWMLRDF